VAVAGGVCGLLAGGGGCSHENASSRRVEPTSQPAPSPPETPAEGERRVAEARAADEQARRELDESAGRVALAETELAVAEAEARTEEVRQDLLRRHQAAGDTERPDPAALEVSRRKVDAAAAKVGYLRALRDVAISEHRLADARQAEAEAQGAALRGEAAASTEGLRGAAEAELAAMRTAATEAYGRWVAAVERFAAAGPAAPK
jgi:hypothetical protein